MSRYGIFSIVVGYIVAAGMYILLSDSLLYALFPELFQLQSVALLKGMGFVLVTAAFLWFLLSKLTRDESARYQALVEQHSSIMLLLDPETGAIIDGNRAAAEFYGFEQGTLRGMTLSDLAHRPGSRPPLFSGKSLHELDSSLHLLHWTANGEMRRVHLRTGPASHHGKVSLLAIIEDETAEFDYRQELARMDRLHRMLAQGNQLIVKAGDRMELLQGICHAAVDAGGFLFCWVGMSDSLGNIKPLAKAGDDKGYIELVAASIIAGKVSGNGPTGTVMRSGTVQVCNDFLADPLTAPWHEIAQRVGVKSSAAFPIHSGNELVGTFNVYSEETNFFGDKEVETLNTMMQDLTYGLDNLERISAMQATFEVLEASPAILFRWRNSPHWPVDHVTQNVSRWGYSPEQFISGAILFNQLIHPEDRQRIEVEINQYVASGATAYSQVYRLLTADGSLCWVEDRTTVEWGRVDGSKDPRYFQSVLTDITHSREVQLKLEAAVTGMSLLLARVVELREPDLKGHGRRVGELAAAIAARMGLDEQMQQGLRIAGTMHDVGRVRVPVEILTKSGRLDDDELELVQAHSRDGFNLLIPYGFPWQVAEIALQHNERLDGSGYPQGLYGEQILLEARIIAVADVVESMTANRPHRAAKPLELALLEIEQGSGILYDPAVAIACLNLFRETQFAIPD
jgi:PAS domain S-box-containing protein